MSDATCNIHNNYNVLFTDGELLEQLEYLKHELAEVFSAPPTVCRKSPDEIEKLKAELQSVIYQLEEIGYVCVTTRSLL